MAALTQSFTDNYFMDANEQYKHLTEKIKDNLPLTALPIRELVHVFREKGFPITLKTELTITDVYNSGDISGIICIVKNEGEEVIGCALAHLVFLPKSPLYREILEYQRKREKRIKKLRTLS
jgi:hypothetical protein